MGKVATKFFVIDADTLEGDLQSYPSFKSAVECAKNDAEPGLGMYILKVVGRVRCPRTKPIREVPSETVAASSNRS